MDAVAEKGIAGHWLYKRDGEGTTGGQGRARQWVKDLLDMQQQAGSSLEFIENLKIDLFPDEVYVFTPRGHILSLPRGACPVDFAYAVHTEVGNACVACRIDRALAPLSTQLQSGQTVEIVTSKEGRPNPDWLGFVVSARARQGIRNALKLRQRSEAIAFGRSLLSRALAKHQLSLKSLDFRRLRKVFNEFGVRKLDDLLAEIGLGNRVAYLVARKLAQAGASTDVPVDVDQGGAITILGSEGLVVSHAKCCHPIPGDAVVGHLSAGKGLVVHVETCRNIGDTRRRTPDDIIPVRWSPNIKGDYPALLNVDVRARKGVIAELAGVVSSADAGINRIGVVERNAELSSIALEVSVRDRIHLARVMRRLRGVNSVQGISRMKG
jgi:GTP pyrophosphokinase